MTSVAAALSAARAEFKAAGIATAGLDARLLMEEATGRSSARLLADGREPLGNAEGEAFAGMLARRLAGEPVARILGEKEFWGLKLSLSAATLVPRPETEILVEAALGAVSHFHLPPAMHICDLGTGSGAILIALLFELREARGTAVDVSQEALAQARANAERYGLASRIRFCCADYATWAGGRFDLVVANPPYVASEDVAGLAREVRGFDPRLALDGGRDGLAAYRRIAERLAELLAPGGVLAIELGAGQSEAVAAMLTERGMAVHEIRPDLAGLPRALVATWARVDARTARLRFGNGLAMKKGLGIARRSV